MFHYITKLGANQAELLELCKSSAHEVVSDIFATNTPGPLNWTLNTCFGEFPSVWVRLESFRYCTKL